MAQISNLTFLFHPSYAKLKSVLSDISTVWIKVTSFSDICCPFFKNTYRILEGHIKFLVSKKKFFSEL